MVRSRLIAVALLGFGVAVTAACEAKLQNGQECLKSEDCESERCVQYVCMDPNASRAPSTPIDSGAAADGAADTGTAPDGGADTGGAPDTGSAPDTSGAADTGTVSDGGAD